MRLKLLTAVLGMVLAQAAVPAVVHAKVWTDPAVAAQENPDFLLQGEYLTPKNSKEEGILAAQVVALGKGHFRLVRYAGGLPGAGWDGKTIEVLSGEARNGAVGFKAHTGEEELTLAHGKILSSMAGEAVRMERHSPTEGAAAPAGAIVLFDGTQASLANWTKGELDGDLLKQGAQTVANFGAFKLHLEFRLPFKPDTPVGDQDRGNSGIYIHNCYEVQVIDSFGLAYFHQPEAQWAAAFKADFGFAPPSQRVQWAGALYHFKGPDVNMSYPPLAWQTYDIDFAPAQFDATGKKIGNVHITVVHNGVKVQDNVELLHGTGANAKRIEVAKGPIYLQEHGNAVRFRNIWIVPQK